MKKLLKESELRLRKHRRIRKKEMTAKLDRFVYWTSLMVLVIFNLISILMLIPFLILFKGFTVYMFVIVFGLVLGLLFNLLVHGIEHLEAHHHIIAGIIIPVLAVVDLVFVMNLAEKISHSFLRPLSFSSTFTMLAFISAFVIPYLFTVATKKR